MKRIFTGVILVPVVLILVFLPPYLHGLFLLATAVVSMLAAWEFVSLAEKGGAEPPRVAVLLTLALLFAGSFEWPDLTATIFCILCLLLLLYCTFVSPVDRMMADAATAVFCLFYIGLTLVAVPALQEQSNGPSIVAFLLCVVWAGDIFALYIGKAFGRHKLAPRLSPNKTWEGALGSVAGSLLVTAGLLSLAGLLQSWNSGKLSYAEGALYWMPLAVLVNIAAQVGDLAESALKRSVGVKDSGSLLPGHGGVLDRIDALLVAAPVLWYAQVIHQRFF